MSKATKRKHVTKEVLEEYYVPEEDEAIVKITGGRGNNLHEVRSTDGKQYLVSMPTKFRKNVWVKRGDFVIVSPIKEGVKVQGEIVYILYAKQIKYLKEENRWPEEFDEQIKKEIVENVPPKNDSGNNDSEGSSDNDDLFENPNHRPTVYYNDGDDGDTSDESDADDEERCEDVGEIDSDNNIIDSSTEEIISERLKDL